MRRRPLTSLASVCLVCSLGCGGPPPAAPAPEKAEKPAGTAQTAATPAGEGASTTTSTSTTTGAGPGTAPAPAEPAPQSATEEACGQIIVVSYKGAAHAKPGISRSKDAAAKRAQALLDQLKAGADFAELARKESDAPSSAPRGGEMGTYARNAWPQLHYALLGPLFGLQVGQTAPAPVEAPYGYVLVRRCAVEKAHARHILIRYKGAEKAPKSITRTKAQAKQRAEELLRQLDAGADFATLARKESEDGSARRGGDLGIQARGAFAAPFESALFALKPGERSGVVETEFGFHIIERVADPAAR